MCRVAEVDRTQKRLAVQEPALHFEMVSHLMILAQGHGDGSSTDFTISSSPAWLCLQVLKQPTKLTWPS